MASRIKNRVDRKEREKDGPLEDYAREWAEYTTQQRQRDEREKNVNPVLRKRMERERTVPGPKQQATDFYYSEHEPRINADTEADYNYNVNKARAQSVMREAGKRAYESKEKENRARETAKKKAGANKINRVMKNVAQRAEAKHAIDRVGLQQKRAKKW